MPFWYLMVGFLAGLLSGFLGIGGASIMIPFFMMFFSMSQHQAQGTSLAAMLAPVFILAVLKYYHEGHVNVPVALIVAVGLTMGGLVGAHYAQATPDAALKKLFGIYMIVIGIKMVFLK